MNEIIRHLQTTCSLSRDYLEAVDISTPLNRHDIFDVLARNVAVSYLESRFPLPVGFDLM
ncbi:hypothetical protein [Burkholderia vietnamiensis]|uniref:hypothetical protein n=1 Tax=Burkholderia vietnamiensis TaxID=60552 RepID=UPI001CF357C7|nr:hypothetical protein [Burkholderia vietnamiensis]MCA8291877.1 hypothetical protein [Burkholderia vietnamiensis]